MRDQLKFDVEKINILNREGALLGALERDDYDKFVFNVEENQTCEISAEELRQIHVFLLEINGGAE